MSKIVKLDPTYDLWLTYSWSTNNHGICGHMYEVLDYYHILRRHFKVGMLFCEDVTWDEIEAAIRYKYDFTTNEIDDMRQHSLFHDRPRLLTGRNILFTDGGVVNTSRVVMMFDNVFYFACGNKCIKHNTKQNTWVLQDDRVYDPVQLNGINYKKRILFDRLRKYDRQPNDAALVYATANCRMVYDFQPLTEYGKPIIAIVNELPRFSIPAVTFVQPPVLDIFTLFQTYIYTPVPRQFDCSPRFIAECHHYGRDVIYHNIDYWSVDTGLKWRKWDIDHDFSSLALTPDDEIVAIIKGII